MDKKKEVKTFNSCKNRVILLLSWWNYIKSKLLDLIVFKNELWEVNNCLLKSNSSIIY